MQLSHVCMCAKLLQSCLTLCHPRTWSVSSSVRLWPSTASSWQLSLATWLSPSVLLTPRLLAIEITMQVTPCLGLASQLACLTSSVESAWASWAVEPPWLMHTRLLCPRQEYWSGLPCPSSVGNYLIYQTMSLISHCTFKQLD